MDGDYYIEYTENTDADDVFSVRNQRERKKRKNISRETVKSFLQYMKEEKTQTEIIKLLDISRTTAYRLYEKYREGKLDDVDNFITGNDKKKKTLKTYNLEKEILGAEISLNPTCNLHFLKDRLSERNITISCATISRIIKKMGYTRKVVTKIPVNRNSRQNKQLRSIFSDSIINVQDENIFYTDECGFNLHMTKKFGYSPKNSKCHITVPNSKGGNISLLCAISIFGVKCYVLKKGSFNSEDFSNFINNNFEINTGKDIKYLILDNASIHKTNLVQSAIINKKLILKYLPPYSPHLNPIEEFFSVVKQRFSDNISSLNNGDDIIGVITSILENETFDMTGYYRHMRTFLEKARLYEDFF